MIYDFKKSQFSFANDNRDHSSDYLMKVCITVSAAKRKKVASAANGHQLAKPLPAGVVLTDLVKGEWKVGPPIGSGGFGLIYLGLFTLCDLHYIRLQFSEWPRCMAWDCVMLENMSRSLTTVKPMTDT